MERDLVALVGELGGMHMLLAEVGICRQDQQRIANEHLRRRSAMQEGRAPERGSYAIAFCPKDFAGGGDEEQRFIFVFILQAHPQRLPVLRHCDQAERTSARARTSAGEGGGGGGGRVFSRFRSQARYFPVCT